MKINNVIPFFAVFLLILMGCTQDEVIKEDTSVGGKEKISITVTQGGAITRISHEDDGADGLILKWTANDAFKLYGTTTEVLPRQDLLMAMARLLLSQGMRLRMPSMLSFLHQKLRKDGRIATLML